MHRLPERPWPHDLPCRLRPPAPDGLLCAQLGPVAPGLAEGRYDPVQDRVVLYDGTRLEHYFAAYLRDAGAGRLASAFPPADADAIAAAGPGEAEDLILAAFPRQGLCAWPPPIALREPPPPAAARRLRRLAALTGRGLRWPGEPALAPLPVRPLDLFHRRAAEGPPAFVLLAAAAPQGLRLALAVENRAPETRTVEVSFARLGLARDGLYEVFDAERGRLLGRRRGRLALRLPGDSGRLLLLAAAAEAPFVLGGGAHPSLLGPDLHEAETAGEGASWLVAGRLELQGGPGSAVHVVLPERPRLAAVRASVRNRHGQELPFTLRRRGRHLALELPGGRPRALRFRLALAPEGSPQRP